MKIHHMRNATMVIEWGETVLLVDPMLGDAGTMPPFTFFRFKPKRNPIVPFPQNARSVLNKVTHCLITHQHPDHIDKDGTKYLVENEIPVICSSLDAKAFRNKGLNVVQSVNYWKRVDFLGGCIEGIPSRHGYGFVAKPAGNVMGFYIEMPDQPSVYLSSDTIYTEDVNRVLTNYRPDISVVASGSAQFDIFRPLLMTMDDVIRFIKDTPGKAIANHLEAVNHCPTTRTALKKRLTEEGLADKAYVPDDGTVIDIG